MDNNSIEQFNEKIQQIEIDDSCAYTTGSRLIANLIIRGNEGMKKIYKIMRTSKGGYMMQ